jgi:hypothetical protein
MSVEATKDSAADAEWSEKIKAIAEQAAANKDRLQ